ncbi:MAG: hypothetical protein P4L93_04630 [Coriobacteriia bacterium]|nr:hypothetical protein [Coriobacteriia bacterium]
MTRITRASLVIVAALVCSLALSAAAFGVPGDSGANATLLNDYVNSSLTTTLVAGTGAGFNTAYYFKTELYPGQTLNADFIPGPHVVNLKALFFASPTDVRSGTQVSTSLTRLAFTAQSHGMYTVEVATSGRDDDTSTPAGTFTVMPTIRSTQSVTLSAPKASGTLTHKRASSFHGTVAPGHVARVTITIQKKVGSKFKSYTTVRVNSNSSGAWSFKTKLPKRGYRLRASTDQITGYYWAGMSSWRNIYVK